MSDIRFTEMFPLRKWPADTPLDPDIFDTPSKRIIAYCAEEVRRQGDTPWHVLRMYEAWKFAQMYACEMERTSYVPFTPAMVREIGKQVDEVNAFGYRNNHIYVTNSTTGEREQIGEHFLAIEPAIKKLCDEQQELEPISVYAKFEFIHPFNDGNGRTGKILYNWRNGTLDDPVWPIDLFGGIENP